MLLSKEVRFKVISEVEHFFTDRSQKIRNRRWTYDGRRRYPPTAKNPIVDQSLIKLPRQQSFSSPSHTHKKKKKCLSLHHPRLLWTRLQHEPRRPCPHLRFLFLLEPITSLLCFFIIFFIFFILKNTAGPLISPSYLHLQAT